MLLSADIGNSSIKLGLYELSEETPKLLHSFKISSVIERSSDEYEIIIRSLLRSKCSDATVDASVISSVVPSLTHVIRGALYSITDNAPFIIGHGTRTGFKIKTDSPSELGADLVCNAAAALHTAEAPVVIVDMGTATTITYINSSNELEGSVIIPGAAVSLRALTDSAELLGSLSFAKPHNIIGKNTADSIMSGVIYGNLFTIDSFIDNIWKSVENNDIKLNLIATGGLSSHFIPYCRNKFTVVDDLTTFGAAILYRKNRPVK